MRDAAGTGLIDEALEQRHCSRGLGQLHGKSRLFRRKIVRYIGYSNRRGSLCGKLYS
jgi:hypothetical protein